MLRAMLRWMPRWIVISLALAAGCRDPGVIELEGIRDEVCKCTDTVCAEAAMKRVPQTDVPNNHRSQKVAREMMECLAKLYEAERPETGPDAESEAGSAAP
jgi:hypothetical protein